MVIASRNARKEWGYVLVTCSHGPHQHRFQIADAVIVARQLGATLVMPTIKEGLTEPISKFDDIYNVKHFIATLEGVVRIVGRLPEDLRNVNHTSVELPHKITKAEIDNKIRPIFVKSSVIVLNKFLLSMKDVKDERDPEIEAIRCLVQYKALQFQPQIEKLGNRLNNRMKEAAQSLGGKYVAVDYRSTDKACGQRTDNVFTMPKGCLSPLDLGLLLQSHGFARETAIYLTQTRLDESFDPLLKLYPIVITKEYSMPFNEENQFLYSGMTQFELAIDFYICSHSDVLVPIHSSTFYTALAGERIKQGFTHMLVPRLLRIAREAPEATSLTLGVPRIVTKRLHPAYSCLCEQGMSKALALVPSSPTSR
ncbi:protein MANNAN SYNTHESIS-RELATED 1 isoform X2 [Physcomitrium patens]|uniref:O-fucosyltransferase family protein n=1 Tax=Physcomitrium patens TaxID=3218 RepID=A0A7I4ECS5_PHYPA|nr:protein MANNAN SYNTHESIS-RELATED 1-like isoform X1 [Physcomitrium patens]XP_024382684.1 protein MANNAN SYNTHESIS-RELATED 1-like isoform X1 [Physcomitrium patens]XP_024382685.1 protein MANNAN SYNTHESIS-RELATED 1-like isoform X1 [Physcomitrium patens]XP_024382686.1 protein MANNAN SYNTHESIS-RELATED 1-like isoform X1 [Physcomitrium patens]|eukprot:XP_024382683.1 protein MANNAN SYNTHESIS-RELATED 1-like isoform X1 [Physcomitrella patens]